MFTFDGGSGVVNCQGTGYVNGKITFKLDRFTIRARLKITWAFAGEYSGLFIMVRKRSIS